VFDAGWVHVTRFRSVETDPNQQQEVALRPPLVPVFKLLQSAHSFVSSSVGVVQRERGGEELSAPWRRPELHHQAGGVQRPPGGCCGFSVRLRLQPGRKTQQQHLQLHRYLRSVISVQLALKYIHMRLIKASFDQMMIKFNRLGLCRCNLRRSRSRLGF